MLNFITASIFKNGKTSGLTDSFDYGCERSRERALAQATGARRSASATLAPPVPTLCTNLYVRLYKPLKN